MMIKLLEHELLIELEQLCRHIDCCIERRDYREIVQIDKQCQAVLLRIEHFAQLSRCQSVQSQVVRLKQYYRRLLAQSIFIEPAVKQRLIA